MRAVVCLAVACVLAVVAAAAVAPAVPSEDEMQTLFTTYMEQHAKVYTRADFFNRYRLFKEAYGKILAHNALPEGQNKGVKLGLNALADLSKSEYRALLGFARTTPESDYVMGHAHSASPRKLNFRKLKPLPEGEIAADEAVDWVAKGAVNPIRDQMSCGACWAFSAVSTAEAAIFIAGHKLPMLSEQEVVDCTKGKPYYCEGCDGCLMATAYQYMIDHKGLCSAQEYPYTGEDGKCHSDECDATKKIPITSYVNISCTDPDFCDKVVKADEATTIKDYVAKGVVSVAVEADSDVFQYYQSGTLDDDSCGTALDHGVTIVGYGTDKGKAYWTVRNSWGLSWGKKGYINIVQGKNMCGIAMYTEQAYAQ